MASTIRDSMVEQLWYSAWERSGKSQFQRPRRIPSAVAKAVRDLEKLYEKMNGVMSLDTLYQRAREQGWEDEENRPGASGQWNFGKWLVEKALGESVSWMAIPPMPSFKIPTFWITFDGAELTWEGGADVVGKRRNPRSPDDVPHTKTVAETRAILARIPVAERCDDNCPGWIIAEVDREPGEEIEVCDECMTSLPKAMRLSDDDVAQLPEAQKALAEYGAEGPVSNPSRWPSSSVQSLLFDVDVFSPAQAKAWAERHGYHAGKVHTTDSYHRIRQFEPGTRPMRTVDFGHHGIKAVVTASKNDWEEDVGINGRKVSAR